MMEGPTRRRRRRRSRQRSEGAVFQQRAGAERGIGAQPRALPDWQWRTFPVFFAFVLGIVIMGFLAPTPLAVIFYGGLFGLVYGVAHIATRFLVARRRR